MAFQTLEQLCFGTLEERLLMRRISSTHPEADIQWAANRMIGGDLIDVRKSIEDVIYLLRFHVCQFFLTGQLAMSVGIEQTSHDFTGNPDTEDGHCIVQ